MIREEIIKYVEYSSILRKKIKETKSEKVKKVLIKELAEIYNRLDFFRGLNNAFYKKGEYYERTK